MTVPQDFIILFSLSLWMAEISIMKMLNKFLKINYSIHQRWFIRGGVWAESGRMTWNFLRGKGLSKDISFWRHQKYLHLTPNSTYIQQRCPLTWCPNSLAYLVTASKSTTLFQVRTECVESTAPLRGLQEAPVSPSEDRKTINLFQLGFAWQSSLEASWVISETEPSFLLSHPRNTPQPPWQCVVDPWSWHHRIQLDVSLAAQPLLAATAPPMRKWSFPPSSPAPILNPHTGPCTQEVCCLCSHFGTYSVLVWLRWVPWVLTSERSCAYSSEP